MLEQIISIVVILLISYIINLLIDKFIKKVMDKKSNKNLKTILIFFDRFFLALPSDLHHTGLVLIHFPFRDR